MRNYSSQYNVHAACGGMNGREMQAIELSLRPFGEYNFEIGAKLEIENGKIRKTNRSNTSR
jgi:hypothetical protein